MESEHPNSLQADKPLEAELFQTSGYFPQITDVVWLNLPPIVRVLLSTDGTVTKSLEAYFWEPIHVDCQLQALVPSHPNLPVTANEKLWKREVALTGARTQVTYATASSLVRVACLPEDVKQALECGELGIGGVIRQLGLETYRKIVAVGQSPQNTSTPKHVWRAYNLFYEGQALMHITETFDLMQFTR